MQRHGWNLLFHEGLIEQLQKLQTAAQKAQTQDPQGFESNANVKLFNALAQLMLETVPSDPSRDEYRQGNTLGDEHKHWFRAKFFQQYRLFFRYHAPSKVIVYGWVNDDATKRAYESSDDAYRVFSKMLESSHPPSDWDQLLAEARGESDRLQRLAARVAQDHA